MKQHTFNRYKSYVNAQTRLTRRKVRRHLTKSKKQVRSFLEQSVVDAIVVHHGPGVKRGLCHGARLGVEVGMFEAACGGKWMGTEIFGEICDGVRVVQADFSLVEQKWVGSFDMVYSNSLDHARNPFKTVKVWLSQLAPNGRLYVEHTMWHAKLGAKNNRADCYADTWQGYRRLFEKAGHVETILKVVEENGLRRRVFVVR